MFSVSDFSPSGSSDQMQDQMQDQMSWVPPMSWLPEVEELEELVEDQIKEVLPPPQIDFGDLDQAVEDWTLQEFGYGDTMSPPQVSPQMPPQVSPQVSPDPRVDLTEQARQDQFFADADAQCDAQLEKVEQMPPKPQPLWPEICRSIWRFAGALAVGGVCPLRDRGHKEYQARPLHCLGPEHRVSCSPHPY